MQYLYVNKNINVTCKVHTNVNKYGEENLTLSMKIKFDQTCIWRK